MKISQRKIISSIFIAALLIGIIFFLAHAPDTVSVASSSIQNKEISKIVEFFRNIARSPEEKNRLAEINRLVSEKIARDEIKLQQLPKFDRLSFFLAGPIIGSIALPATWEGDYRTEETLTQIDFFCLNSAKDNLLFSIAQIDASAAQVLADKKNWQELGREDEKIFYIKKSSSDYLSAECQKMMNDLDSVKKSFRSQKQ